VLSRCQSILCFHVVNVELGLLVAANISRKEVGVFQWQKQFSGAGAGAGEEMKIVRSYSFGSRTGFHFNFTDETGNCVSGWLAFSEMRPHHVLVTDVGNHLVHVLDVVGRAHAGYVFDPEALVHCPRGVASKRDLVAVSSWVDRRDHHAAVSIYQGHSNDVSHWCLLWRMACPSAQPAALKFSQDGSFLVVSECTRNKPLTLINLLARRKVGVVCPPSSAGLVFDLLQCGTGWLVSCTDGLWFCRTLTDEDGAVAAELVSPSASSSCALVPGMMFVARWGFDKGGAYVAPVPSVVSMALMSDCRVQWMAAVYRSFSRALTAMLS
jgi:hypothetical protein